MQGISKVITIMLLMVVIVSASVTISTDKSSYDCYLSSCEIVNINIFKTGPPLEEQVHLVIDYVDDNGEISNVKTFIKKNKKTTYELSTPFDLPNGNKFYNMEFNARGSGKFNISIIGADTGNVYYVLDPFWNSTFIFRNQFNLTSSGTNLFYNYKLTFNNSNIDYAKTNPDGSDLRFTWLNETSGLEQLIPHWIQEETGWNITGNSYVWILAPKIDSNNETYYYYYSNMTPVTTTSNGYTTFPAFFDDGNDGTLNTTLWDTSQAGGYTITETGGEIVLTSDGVNDGALKSQTGYDWGTDKILTQRFYQDTTGSYGSGSYFGLNLLSGDFESTYAQTDFFVQMSNANGQIKIRSQKASVSDTSAVFNHNGYKVMDFVRENTTACRTFVSGASADSRTTQVPTADLGIVYSNAPSYNTLGDFVKIDWVFIHNYSSDNFSIAFGGEGTESVSITSPLENSTLFMENVNLKLSVPFINVNYSIYIDSVFEKSINITETIYTDYFDLTEGEHTFLVTRTTNESFNDSVDFNTTGFVITDVTYENEEFELFYTNFNATLRHLESINFLSGNFTYDGTDYDLTITAVNSTTDHLSIRFFTPFLENGTSETFNFSIQAIADNSNTSIFENNQTIILAYFINSVDPQTTGTEGELITQNVYITNIANIAIVKLFMNNSEIGLIEGDYISGTTNQTWEVVFNLPATTPIRSINLSNYLRVEYNSVIGLRAFAVGNITINPILFGNCGGIFTEEVLNYSLWNEEDYSQHLPIAGTTNQWETFIQASALGGSVVKEFSFKNTTQDFLICIPANLTLNANISTWVNDDNSTFAKRSHFMLNKELSNETNQIKIFTLNFSKYANIDFLVYDVYSNPVENRIIHFYLFYPEINGYQEIFNLITDKSGKAVAHLKPYDSWYKIIVTDENGRITQTIEKTQISASTYSITESSLVEYFAVYGISVDPIQYNNVSRIASISVSGEEEHPYKFEIKNIGFFSNETYCINNLNTTTGTLYCDLSNSSITDFKWSLSVYDGQQWIIFTGGNVSTNIPTFGKIGLLITSLIIMTGSFIFEEPKAKILMVIITIAISNLIGVLTASDSAILGIIFVGLTLLYMIRKN